jgi:hypothetical protein
VPDLEELVLYGNPVHWNIVSKEGELAYAAQVFTLLPGTLPSPAMQRASPPPPPRRPFQTSLG